MADGSGTLKFHPAGGAPGKREIQGVVYAADGYLTSRLELGTYTAPAPQRPAKAKKLTVRRVGKKLVLRWKGDKAAYKQQVDIRSAAGLNMTRMVKRSTTSIALPAAGIIAITLVAAVQPNLQGILLTAETLGFLIAAMALIPKLPKTLPKQSSTPASA